VTATSGLLLLPGGAAAAAPSPALTPATAQTAPPVSSYLEIVGICTVFNRPIPTNPEVCLFPDCVYDTALPKGFVCLGPGCTKICPQTQSPAAAAGAPRPEEAQTPCVEMCPPPPLLCTVINLVPHLHCLQPGGTWRASRLS
jgi:hypothetical protein